GSEQEGETVSLQGMRLESRTRTAADETIQVDSSLQVATVAVDAVASDSLVLEEVAVTWNSTQQGSLLDAAARYEIQRILMGDNNLGSVVLGGKAARLDLEAFSALASEYDAIAREHGAGSGEDFDPTVEDQERMLARLLPVLATRPELALDPLVWRNEKGESSLALNIALQPVAEEGDGFEEDILAAALRELRFDIALSRSMLMQLVSGAAGSDGESAQFEMLAAFMYDTYIGQLEQAGLVRRDGDRDMTSVVYSDGMVDINGQAMSLPEFLMLLGLFGL
ncbi:MAG: YdgA family protein, partial [Alcaligenaceae bacterium]|nr:YdgA family protein [Alcaligenaceae bacterium]